MKANQFVINFYLDYFNNYLSVAKIAANNGISVECAWFLITEGRKLHEAKISEANNNLVAMRENQSQ